MTTDESAPIQGELVEAKGLRSQVLVPKNAGLVDAQGQASGDEMDHWLSQVFTFVDDPIRGTIAAWFSDKLRSDESVADYSRALKRFWLRMQAQDVSPLEVQGDHVRLYKKAMEKAGSRSAAIAANLSVIRGMYQQLAVRGHVAWEVAQDIQAVEAPVVEKNSTPALTSKQAVAFLDAIPEETLKGKRDLAMMETYFITGCRVSAIIKARVGDLHTDGVEWFLHVTEKRNKERDRILLDAARSVVAYVEAAGIEEDAEGPLFRPMTPDAAGFERRFMNRLTPWRLVKHYCRAAGINPDRLSGRGISPHSIRKTAINDALDNGAPLEQVREFATHSDIRTTQLYYTQKEKDAELAARRIQIRRSR